MRAWPVGDVPDLFDEARALPSKADRMPANAPLSNARR